MAKAAAASHWSYLDVFNQEYHRDAIPLTPLDDVEDDKIWG